jgi:hypothetical protein
VRTLGARYDGRAADEPGDDLLVVYHCDAAPGRMTLPPGRFAVLLDSADEARAGVVEGGLELAPWSVVVLRDEP